jgi:hypothetical protein
MNAVSDLHLAHLRRRDAWAGSIAAGAPKFYGLFTRLYDAMRQDR